MRRYLIIMLLAFLPRIASVGNAMAATSNPRAITGLLDRIGGKGTAKRIETELDGSFAKEGGEQFLIGSRKGKPFIKGSSLTAISAGINWYLNHFARVNLSWNALTTDLSTTPLPLPQKEECHTCTADYRYYLNYCTFGYSMSTWTWERWEKEIDWMALHGINMPLQIVGLESVWRSFLMEDCHYSEEEAERFIPGPAYTAWWGMNNLEGWGNVFTQQTEDKDDDAPSSSTQKVGNGRRTAEQVHLMRLWCQRQADLARRICQRERELGMQPVLPGFSGMVPSNFEEKTGIKTEKANLWCQFQRPAILDPSSPDFARLASCYYTHLRAIMGESVYYSMDPFHEGGTISSGRYSEGYRAVFDAMEESCGTASKWVIQQWQWADYQATSLSAVPGGRLIVLDLFSDGTPRFDHYKGYAPQEAIYCTIPNFGGRTGFMGRLPRMAESYFDCLSRFPSLKGIGTAPEAIESVPVVYDLLFELPWMTEKPDMEEWISEYATRRYGTSSAPAQEAWKGILHTALNEVSSLQGPHEAVMCARPSLQVDRVSSWGGAMVFYDKTTFCSAVRQLLTAAEGIGTSGSLGARNMSYDLTDLTRQTLSDYSQTLLQRMKLAHDAGERQEFSRLSQEFLQLILDTDRLLATSSLFRLGHWTQSAREIAKEVMRYEKRKLTKEQRLKEEEELADWLEYDNARQLITTWGDQRHSEAGGLRDYSYRQWQGLLRDYYYPRWAYFLQHTSDQLSAPTDGWFWSEWNWAHELDGEWGTMGKGTVRHASPKRYSAQPEGSTYEISKHLINKYIKQ